MQQDLPPIHATHSRHSQGHDHSLPSVTPLLEIELQDQAPQVLRQVQVSPLHYRAHQDLVSHEGARQHHHHSGNDLPDIERPHLLQSEARHHRQRFERAYLGHRAHLHKSRVRLGCRNQHRDAVFQLSPEDHVRPTFHLQVLLKTLLVPRNHHFLTASPVALVP